MAKITALRPTGEQWKDFYIMEVTLDDNTFGNALAKSPIPWYNVGDEVKYTKNARGGLKIEKPEMAGYSPAGGGQSYQSRPQYGGSKDEQIARSVAFKGAIDLVVGGKAQIADIAKMTATFTALVLGQEEKPQGRTHDNHFAETDMPF
jgi:hypothetical protein